MPVHRLLPKGEDRGNGSGGRLKKTPLSGLIFTEQPCYLVGVLLNLPEIKTVLDHHCCVSSVMTECWPSANILVPAS